MILKLRKSFILKPTAVFLTLLTLVSNLLPLTASALTSSFIQPEYSGFKASSSSDMVDLFTGDFGYNIPLFEIGGYPVNLSYKAGASMEDEASWTGLGWNLNPGAITRNMRDIPDDFKGDTVHRDINFLPFNQHTSEFTGGVSVDILTIFFPPAHAGVGLNMSVLSGWDNYDGRIRGFGFGLDVFAGVGFYGMSAMINASASEMHSSLNGFTTTLSASASVSFMGVASASVGIQATNNHRTGTKTTLEYVGLEAGGYSGGCYSFHSNAVPSILPNSFPDVLTYYSSRSFTVGASFGPLGVSGVSTKTTTDVSMQRSAYNYNGYGVMYDETPGQFNTVDDYSKLTQVDNFSYLTNLLSQPIKGNDFFNVTGQGIPGGVYKIARNDAKVFKPTKSIFLNVIPNAGTDQDLNISIPVSGYDKDKKSMSMLTTRGGWENLSAESNLIQPIANPTSESKYFKMLDDLSPANAAYNTAIGDVNRIDAPLVSTSNQPSLANTTTEAYDVTHLTGVSGVMQSTSPNPRAGILSYLTAKEAQVVGRNKTIDFYQADASGNLIFTQESRVNSFRQPHHLSEFSYTGENGSRMVYGIPSYNKTYEKHHFSVTPPNDPNNNTTQGNSEYMPLYATYDSTSDDGVTNTKGKQHTWGTEKIAPFATNFLLTEVLSSDYVDVTDNGISDDDLGNYTKFSYERLPNDYKWRYPVTAQVSGATPQGVFEKGETGDFQDDMVSYTYGKKESWYIHTIESKDEIAFFYMSERADARPVVSQHGLINTQTGYGLQKLDSIQIYSKYAYNSGNRVPIKTVHFVYDYSLCSGGNGVPNQVMQGQGKLTLKSLYFTYGTDYTGANTPYIFSYNNNYQYNPQAVDRWGTYKPEMNYPGDDDGYPSNMNNIQFPYCYQNPSHEVDYDAFASAWNLSTVQLPTGGVINITYEADRYGYVQNLPAQQMYEVAGFLRAIPQQAPSTPANAVGINPFNYAGFSFDYAKNSIWDYDHTPANLQGKGHRHQKQYIVIRLPDNTDQTFNNALQIITTGPNAGTSALANTNMFFSLDGIVYGSGGSELHQRANGFAHISSGQYSIERLKYNQTLNVPNPGAPNDYTQFVCIQVDQVEQDDAYTSADGYMSPFSRALWSSLVENNDFKSIVYGSAQTALSYLQMWARDIDAATNGRYSVMEELETCKFINLSQSWVRLSCQNTQKYGGGHRVKQISYYDNWDNMTNDGTNNETGHFYQQNYAYGTGVAAYEPYEGNEENPFKTPMDGNLPPYNVSPYSDVAKDKVPDYVKQYVGPVCENYFPSPVIGYDSVTITASAASSPSVTSSNVTSNGAVTFQFYTFKDFPYQTDFAAIQKSNNQSNLQASFSSNAFGYSYMYATQGFKVSANNMHGKLKSITMTDNNNIIVKSVTYNYLTNNGQLSSSVSCLNKSGTISPGDLGKDIDVCFESLGQSELDVMNQNILKVRIFLIIPWWFRQHLSTNTLSDYRYLANVKLVSQTGILQSIDYVDRDTKYTVKNELYDQLTGNPISQSTTVEFANAKNYSISIPAYYTYNNMGPAFQNIRQAGTINITSGITTGTSSFVKGDELLLAYPPASTVTHSPTTAQDFLKAWVAADATSTSGQVQLIDQGGKLIGDGNYDFTIIRSGDRNMLSNSAAQYTATNSFVNGSSINLGASANLLSASVTTYTEKGTYNNPGFGYTVNTQSTNAPGLGDLINDLGSLLSVGYSVSTAPQFVGNSSYAALGIPLKFYNGFSTFSGTSGHLVYFNSSYVTPFSLLNTAPYANLDFHVIGNNPVSFSGGSFSTNIDPASVGDPLNNKGLILKYTDGSGNISLISFTSPDIPITTQLSSCNISPPNAAVSCGISTSPSQLVNPFLLSLLSIWKPYQSYVYNSPRYYTPGSGTIPLNNEFDITQDGYFTSFNSFWNNLFQFSGSTSNWLKTSTDDMPHPIGTNVEEIDVQNRHSCSLLGYADTKVIAQVNNSTYTESGYDGFEDYDLPYYLHCFDCNPLPHFSFQVPFGPNKGTPYITNTTSHTGKYSMALPGGSTPTPATMIRNYNGSSASYSAIPNSFPYSFAVTDYVSQFNPDPGQYIFNFWASRDAGVSDFTNLKITVQTFNSGSIVDNYTFTPQRIDAQTIEGWQRFEFPVKISSSVNSITITFSNTGSSESNYYVDDVRFHPFNASMQSYVYDKLYLRISASLDDQNFATFYEYDDAGNAIRTKVETERGVYTVAEKRSHIFKQ